MTDGCAGHRPYLAAVADGEDGLVPAATRQHVDGCPSCQREIAAHAQLGEMLRSAPLDGSSPVPAPAGGRRPRWHRLALAASVAATLVLGALGTVAWQREHNRFDPVALAVAAAHHRPVLETSDPQAIATWCASNSDRRDPPIAIAALTPVGARMDVQSGATVVTVFYQNATGHQITVGWIDADSSHMADTGAAARTVDSSGVIVLRTSAGTAVVTGDAPFAGLWAVAGAVESAGGS